MVDESHPLKVAIVLFPGVEELDFVGPWEVFTMAKTAGASIEAFTVAWPETEIKCAKGLRVTADHKLVEAPVADIVVIPGGQGTRTLVNDVPFIDALRAYTAQARWHTSVCTGAALLGQAGFLDGRRYTTNRLAFDFVRTHAPNAYLIDDRRWIHEDSVVTSAGVSAGIDMSLWLLGHLFGEDLARTTQGYLEYYPEPPYGNAVR